MRIFLIVIRFLRALTIGLLAAAPFFGKLSAKKRWPRVNGQLKINGLKALVEIIRDKWGGVHIYSENEHDLFFAQCYIHAQDRLWQMEQGRRMCEGNKHNSWKSRYLRGQVFQDP